MGDEGGVIRTGEQKITGRCGGLDLDLDLEGGRFIFLLIRSLLLKTSQRLINPSSPSIKQRLNGSGTFNWTRFGWVVIAGGWGGSEEFPAAHNIFFKMKFPPRFNENWIKSKSGSEEAKTGH